MDGVNQAKTVLVTEDNPLHMKIFKLNLSLLSVNILAAANGAEALALAQQHHPDLAIVDLTLPKMDGWALIQALRADPATARTTVVIVSARRPQDEAAAGQASGIAAYVTKPFDPEALTALVAALLGIA